MARVIFWRIDAVAGVENLLWREKKRKEKKSCTTFYFDCVPAKKTTTNSGKRRNGGWTRRAKKSVENDFYYPRTLVNPVGIKVALSLALATSNMAACPWTRHPPQLMRLYLKGIDRLHKRKCNFLDFNYLGLCLRPVFRALLIGIFSGRCKVTQQLTNKKKTT